jgi:hypothetical protein
MWPDVFKAPDTGEEDGHGYKRRTEQYWRHRKWVLDQDVQRAEGELRRIEGAT